MINFKKTHSFNDHPATYVHFAATTTFACLVRHETKNSTTTQGKLKKNRRIYKRK